MPYFQTFQPFSVTVTFFMNSITFVMNHLFSYFDISICHSSNRTLSYRLLLTHDFNHDYILGGACYIHLTKRTSTHHIVYYFYILVNFYKQTFPCIHIFPLNLLPISGSPIRSFSLMQTLKIRSLHSTLRQYICSPDTLFSSFV